MSTGGNLDPSTFVRGETLRTREPQTGIVAAVLGMCGTFGGLAIGVLLTLAIVAAVFFAVTSRTTVRTEPRKPDISIDGYISEDQLREILKAEREAHQRGTRELADKYEALRSNVAQWQTYCESTRCRCRHPGAPGSPGVGAVGSAVMESAPPKVGDK